MNPLKDWKFYVVFILFTVGVLLPPPVVVVTRGIVAGAGAMAFWMHFFRREAA